MTMLDLLKGVSIVVTGNWDISTVQNLTPEIEWVGILRTSLYQHFTILLSILRPDTYTLYPPLNPSFREPLFSSSGQLTCIERGTY